MLPMFYFPKIFKSKDTRFYYLSLLKNDNCAYGYTIHGFWPQFSKTSYPQFCKKVTFDINKLKPIENDLISFWELPEDTNKLEIKFWSHEWCKHGSCMFKEMGELEYFQTALKLYENIMKMGLGFNIEKYKKGKNYLIPFDLNFNLLKD